MRGQTALQLDEETVCPSRYYWAPFILIGNWKSGSRAVRIQRVISRQIMLRQDGYVKV